MKKFAILVGNGFTLDFLKENGSEYHSSFPLKHFKNLGINYHHFIDQLPFVKDELLGQDEDDYKVIEQYASSYDLDSFQVGQLRQFLAISYSLLQIKIDGYDHSNWKWRNWLYENKEFLECAISLNYDLVLERTLSSARIPYSRSGTDESLRKVQVMKPHGSIDFDIPSNAISMDYFSRFHSLTFLNDAGNVNILPKWEWTVPRTEADIIPPSVRNYQEKLRWVKKISDRYSSSSNYLEAFIIVGSSYWDVDRNEINFYLEKLPKTAIVYIANNEPDEFLIEKITSLGLSFETFGFDELPW